MGVDEWSVWIDDRNPGDDFDFTDTNGVTFSQNGYPKINSVKALNKILNLAHVSLDHYHKFSIYTKGKERTIYSPGWNLKKRQKWILRYILNNYQLPDCVHGFTSHKSIVTNALCHIGKNEIGCMDIKDFFPTVNSSMIMDIFLSMDYPKNVASLLTDICTFEEKLPQGAPTSPMLANIALSTFDTAVLKYVNDNGLTYTRYADDITISGDHNIENHLDIIKNILLEHGFSPNEKKTRVTKGNYRKIVTGLVVSDKVKVPKRYKKKFRQEIYYCQKFGILQHLKNTKQTSAVNFREYMYGKAYFIKMVEPEVGEELLVQLDEIFSYGY